MEHPGPAGANPEQLRSTQDFVFEAVLGSGNFGVVHRAVRKQDGRTYAIKQVDLRGMTRAEMVDSVKEVQVLASLSSPHCIRYHDSFLDEPSCQLFIVMEYAEGGNLHDAIRKCPSDTQLPEAVVWRLLLQMALGLHHMHSRRILHRDVKSMNVFLDGQGNAKIGDVGVAKVLSNTSSMARTVIGTPYYLSPEICQGRPYGAKSDVWALGVVLYECCTRRYPFQANSQYALALKILRGKYPPISGYSYELADVIKRCLTLSAAARPAIARLLSLPSVRAKAATLGIQLPELAGLGAAQRAAAASTASSRPPVPSPTQRKAAATAAAAAAAAGSPVARRGRSSVQAELSGSGGSEAGKAPASDQEGSGRAGQKAREERSASSLPFWAPWQTGGSIGGSSDGQPADALDATVKSGSQLSIEAQHEGSGGQRAVRRPEPREPTSPAQKTMRQQPAAGAGPSPRARQPAAASCASPTARPGAAACASPTAGAPCSPGARQSASPAMQQSPGRPSSPAAEWLARRAAARAAAAAAKSPEARQPQHPQQPSAHAAASATSSLQDEGCAELSSTTNRPCARSPEPSGNLQPAAAASAETKGGREERRLGVAADCRKADESGGASGAGDTVDVPSQQRRHQQSPQRAVLPRPVWHWEDA